jgi:hypothetical protein
MQKPLRKKRLFLCLYVLGIFEKFQNFEICFFGSIKKKD